MLQLQKLNALPAQVVHMVKELKTEELDQLREE
jgi:hypothetical protein